MTTAKHAYTDEELEVMSADDYYVAIGRMDELRELAREAREAYNNGTVKITWWNRNREDRGIN